MTTTWRLRKQNRMAPGMLTSERRNEGDKGDDGGSTAHRPASWYRAAQAHRRRRSKAPMAGMQRRSSSGGRTTG
ncbi:hypothetical protein E2562_011393 [Oryza meyeriana var. granulata]|nr:hypothetical protein E2562_011393 [Oryza meyeriana var. granulata]